MAKVHVVEWTPAILNEDFVEDSVLIEWFGKLSHRAIKWLIGNNITVSANTIRASVGQPKDLRGVNFSLTEEFVALYRMHPLLPDYIDILAMDSGKQSKMFGDKKYFKKFSDQLQFDKKY